MDHDTHHCSNCQRLGRKGVEATHRAREGTVGWFYLCDPCTIGYNRQAFVSAEPLAA